ncbi:DUF1906 domain-containing protein [Streptomyces sp. KR80]|uniref:DUF1906 domain-containing protein n=1 Tax=Streptomyces sp. KR80 TaxID=3457426 RepID=UPI003FD3A08A
MERRKKIIQYVIALLTAIAAVVSSLVTGATAVADASAGNGDLRSEGAEIFTGLGFDTCETPSLGAMSAWRKSNYRAVGVYIGGRGRACKKQTHLGRRWIREVTDREWKVLPVYVGSQSPCVHSKKKKHVPINKEPWSQGLEEGKDAVAKAAGLGMQERSAIYLDMEAYDRSDRNCAETTLSFIRSWSREVRSRGYFPGFYSSSTSGVKHVETARQRGVRDLPDVVWFARWNVPPSLYEEPVLDQTAWGPHRRIHQFKGNVVEEHGGVRLKIDRNLIDAPVAVVE